MSEHIYTILASKKHNPHFLKRYVKFIDACLAKNQNLSSDVYVEQHHICPKDKDLFPEFKSFKTYPWNKAVLTARQHYIAHQMLMKAYGGGQIYAFVAMNKQSRKSSNQTERYRKPNSTFYANAKKANNEWMSESRKGKAAYVDENGETFYVRTDDPRVSLGELKSMTKGRVHKKYTPEERKARKRLFQEKVKNVPKFGNIYFLEFKLKVDKRSEKFIELLEQGWSTTITDEFRSHTSTRINNERYDKRGIIELKNGDYSKYRVLYDFDQECFLSGDPLFWKKKSDAVRNITGNKNFKSYKDQLTGINYQVLNTIQVPDWFIPNQNPNKK